MGLPPLRQGLQLGVPVLGSGCAPRVVLAGWARLVKQPGASTRADILRALRKTGGCGLRELATRLSLPSYTVRGHLAMMVPAGEVTQEGGKGAKIYRAAARRSTVSFHGGAVVKRVVTVPQMPFGLPAPRSDTP